MEEPAELDAGFANEYQSPLEEDSGGPTEIRLGKRNNFKSMLLEESGVPVAFTQEYSDEVSGTDPALASGFFAALDQYSEQMKNGGVRTTTCNDETIQHQRRLKLGEKNVLLILQSKNWWELSNYTSKMIDKHLPEIYGNDLIRSYRSFLESMNQEIQKETRQLAECFETVAKQNDGNPNCMFIKPSGNRIGALSNAPEDLVRTMEVVANNGVMSPLYMKHGQEGYWITYNERFETYIVSKA